MQRVVLAGLVLIAAASVSTTARADEWTKKYSLTGKAELRVGTNDGTVRVRPGSSQEIEARVSTSGWRISPDEVRVVEHQTGNRVELEVKIPRTHWNNFHRSLHIELAVPPEANLEIHTGDGDVTLEGIRGESHVATGDGNIDASSLDGDFEATTGDGNIRVAGRFDRLNLKTGDGKIDAEVNSGSKMAADWSARSGDGDLQMRLPADFAADLEAHTGDGSIDLDFPVTVSGSLRQSEIRGKINGGGQTLRVHTGDGSIRLRKL